VERRVVSERRLERTKARARWKESCERMEA
jgi:hypothetical protein